MNLLNLVIPAWARWAAIAALITTVYGLGRLHQAQHAEHERDKATIEFMRQGDQHVARYYEKNRQLVDIRTAAGRLSRMCQQWSLRHSGGADEAAAPHAGDRRSDEDQTGPEQLAADLLAAQDNKHKLEELQATLRPQLLRRYSWWDPRGWF